jgi:hypothetical protein
MLAATSKRVHKMKIVNSIFPSPFSFFEDFKLGLRRLCLNLQFHFSSPKENVAVSKPQETHHLP